MAQIFIRFAEQTSGSPMYRYLSLSVSDDADLLKLASYTNEKQPAPNLFFSAVHFLLMQNTNDRLANYYPSLGGQFTPTDEMFNCFKTFCKKFEIEIRKILAVRLVKTNDWIEWSAESQVLTL